MTTKTNNEIQARERGRDAGIGASSWLWDGNTTTETYVTFLKTYDEGTLDESYLAPSPLSGEWAGESVTELLGDLLGDDEEENLFILDEYEDAFMDAWYENLVTIAKYQTEEDSE